MNRINMGYGQLEPTGDSLIEGGLAAQTSGASSARAQIRSVIQPAD